LITSLDTNEPITNIENFLGELTESPTRGKKKTSVNLDARKNAIERKSGA